MLCPTQTIASLSAAEIALSTQPSDNSLDRQGSPRDMNKVVDKLNGLYRKLHTGIVQQPPGGRSAACRRRLPKSSQQDLQPSASSQTADGAQGSKCSLSEYDTANQSFQDARSDRYTYVKAPLRTPSIHARPGNVPKSVSQSDSPTVHLAHDYRHAQACLACAQQAFDTREDVRDQEEKENKEMLEVSHGQVGMPLEEFDLRWMEHISRLTRKLINAEERYRSARMAAIQGGWSLDDDEDASSIFSNYSGGYAESEEAEMLASAPRGMIETWRRKIPAIFHRPETGSILRQSISDIKLGVDDGLYPWDSWSAVAEPRQKAKIERWTLASSSLGKVLVGKDRH